MLKVSVSVMALLMLVNLGCSGSVAEVSGRITTDEPVSLAAGAKVKIEIWEYEKQVADKPADLAKTVVLVEALTFPIAFEVEGIPLRDRSKFGYYLTVHVDLNGDGGIDEGDYRASDFNRLFEDDTTEVREIDVVRVGTD